MSGFGDGSLGNDLDVFAQGARGLAGGAAESALTKERALEGGALPFLALGAGLSSRWPFLF